MDETHEVAAKALIAEMNDDPETAWNLVQQLDFKQAENLYASAGVLQVMALELGRDRGWIPA